jgi:hypothetical protein
LRCGPAGNAANRSHRRRVRGVDAERFRAFGRQAPTRSLNDQPKYSANFTHFDYADPDAE